MPLDAAEALVTLGVSVAVGVSSLALTCYSLSSNWWIRQDGNGRPGGERVRTRVEPRMMRDPGKRVFTVSRWRVSSWSFANLLNASLSVRDRVRFGIRMHYL